MKTVSQANSTAFSPIENATLNHALNELGRSINLITTYGKNHPAALNALENTGLAMQAVFAERKKLVIGAYNGVLTVDGKAVGTIGTLQKSLERRLVRLNITGLRLARGISRKELAQLAELLSSNDNETFQSGIRSGGMDHIETENLRFQAVREGQAVVNESNLAHMGENGVLVLEDATAPESGNGNNLHVEQIVAFLKGDIDENQGDIGDELTDLASNPDKLGRMIMESVAIRQSISELSGESLNDVILGCLRRTYDGLRKQPAFQSSKGKAELRKALLLLEENILERIRGLAGEENPELDRQIVQAVREMDESLKFEMVAAQYMEHREAIEQNKQQLQEFIQEQGADTAETLLSGSGFPRTDWRKIVMESRPEISGASGTAALASGLNTLATVFDKLEQLMKSETGDNLQVKDLLGQANENLDDTLDTTKEKLAALSQHLKNETATIGGQARDMSREDLLSALSEVAQELMQPLTAINTSLEMMLQGYVGEITSEQGELLKLASNSGEHLKFLMKMLVDIVGCPTNKGVDSRFHTTSDRVVLMQDGKE